MAVLQGDLAENYHLTSPFTYKCICNFNAPVTSKGNMTFKDNITGRYDRMSPSPLPALDYLNFIRLVL